MLKLKPMQAYILKFSFAYYFKMILYIFSLPVIDEVNWMDNHDQSNMI